MKKKFVLIILIAFFSLNVSAQFTKYIVRFKDKTGTPFSITDPSKFLSPKAIERRSKQKIAINETDLPVVPRYIDSIRLSGDVIVLDKSKWLNQVCIQTSDSTVIARINSFPFVIKTQPVKRMMSFSERNDSEEKISKNKFNERVTMITSSTSSQQIFGNYYSYGNSFAQVHIHNGEYLHNKGFRGDGMLIAILDAGFYHYKTLAAFDSVNQRNQVIDTYDFVNNENSVNEDHEHGMMCFSTIGANLPGQMVGTCPNAHFLLYRSEDASTESPVEEQYWIAAAERADSAGADIITTSLGYTLFDNPVFDYSYQDMNGHTSMIAKAASMAAQKGMIVLAAAGNDGDDGWHFISTPADADSILTVGAVNTSGEVAPFSSYGPSSDGRVKPTVASVGWGTTIFSPTGSVAYGSGTSFATPNLAGLVTCLWQAFPDLNNMQIIEAVKQSSSIYNNPDNRIGYGIPDFKKAFDDLTQKEIIKKASMILGNNFIKVFPNPARDQFTVLIRPENTSTGTFRLYDAAGKLLFSKETSLQKGEVQFIPFKMQPLQMGMYILKFSDGKSKVSIPILIQ